MAYRQSRQNALSVASLNKKSCHILIYKIVYPMIKVIPRDWDWTLFLILTQSVQEYVVVVGRCALISNAVKV